MSAIGQRDFRGGMVRIGEDTTIPDSTYRLLINGRTRLGPIESIKSPILDLNAPSGKKHGLYTVGSFLVLFSGGNAYFRLHTDTVWIQIAGFSMSDEVELYGFELVPKSTVNFSRVLGVEIDNSSVTTTINLVDTSVPPVAIVQDGVNQAFKIFELGGFVIAERTGNYETWTTEIREYVPIGTDMVYNDGILFTLSPDRTQIYRSVTGRPLDYMVQINGQGLKISEDELIGGAAPVSHAVGFTPISALRAFSAGKLFVATENSVYIVEILKDLDPQLLPFGEPIFKNSDPIHASCINQSAYVSVPGNINGTSESLFLDYDGLRALTSVAADENKGRNTFFGLNLAQDLKGKVQDPLKSSAILHDDYVYFSVETTFYGRILIVYDTLSQTFVSYDSHVETLDGVKQFASINTTVLKLFAITVKDEVVEISPATGTTAETQFTPKSLSSGDARVLTQLHHVWTIFNNPGTTDTISLVPHVDEVPMLYVDAQGNSIAALTKDFFPLSVSGIFAPVTAPVTVYENNIQNLKWDLDSFSQTGWKATVVLRWDNGAKLIHFQMQSKDETHEHSVAEQRKEYGR